MTRQIRKQPFCWQGKDVLRYLRKKYKGAELVKMRNLYLTLTEIDSDFNGKEIKYYTKTISTYSGLSTEWIPSGLKELETIGVVKIFEIREGGKFAGKYLELINPTDTSFTVKGKTVNGETDTLEHSIYLEQRKRFMSSDKSSDINKNPQTQTHTEPETSIVNSKREGQKISGFSYSSNKPKTQTQETDLEIKHTRTGEQFGFIKIAQKQKQKRKGRKLSIACKIYASESGIGYKMPVAVEREIDKVVNSENQEEIKLWKQHVIDHLLHATGWNTGLLLEKWAERKNGNDTPYRWKPDQQIAIKQDETQWERISETYYRNQIKNIDFMVDSEIKRLERYKVLLDMGYDGKLVNVEYLDGKTDIIKTQEKNK